MYTTNRTMEFDFYRLLGLKPVAQLTGASIQYLPMATNAPIAMVNFGGIN